MAPTVPRFRAVRPVSWASTVQIRKNEAVRTDFNRKINSRRAPKELKSLYMVKLQRHFRS